MARTRIEDLPKDIKINRKEMGRIFGGVGADRPDKTTASGGTPQDAVDAFVDANPGLIVHTDGSPFADRETALERLARVDREAWCEKYPDAPVCQ